MLVYTSFSVQTLQTIYKQENQREARMSKSVDTGLVERKVIRPFKPGQTARVRYAMLYAAYADYAAKDLYTPV